MTGQAPTTTAIPTTPAPSGRIVPLPAPAPPTPALRAFRDLEAWLETAGAEQATVGAVERHALTAGREVLRLMLQAHLDARGPGDLGPVLLVDSPDGPRRYSHKRRQTRRLLTVFGSVTITRIGYGRPGRPSIHPLDAQLQLPARCYSYELQRRLVGAAVRGPFDEAIASVAQATGVVIPKRAAEQLVVDTATDVEAFYLQRSHAHDDGEPAAAVLVGTIDCKGIPMVKPEPAVKAVRLGKGQKRNKKKMATVGCVYGHHPYPRTPEQVVASLFDPPDQRPRPDDSQPRRRPQRKRVWASLLAGKDTFITDVRGEMTRRDPDHHRVWVIVTDGEVALQRRVGRIFTTDQVTLILDLLHVLEKLWDAAHALHPEGSADAITYVRARTLWILQGRSGQVVKGIRQTVTKRQITGSRRDTLLRVAGYFHRNRERMRYHTYLAHGWPIASGTVEGACKTLVRDRMERSGMRWTPTMAEAMLRLRATYLSGDIDAYWDFHVGQDQQRLHPDGLWTVVTK